MQSFFQNIWTSISSFFAELGSSADQILIGLIKIIAILIVAKLLIITVRHIIRRMLRRRKKNKPMSAMAKKSDTIESVAGSVAKYLVWFLAAVAILDTLGLGSTVGSLLATAGIGGIAVAFGAQNLVRDVVSGMFILIEDQYAVGEYVEIGDETGTVDAITVRTTRITRFSGETTTIPNGSITKVTNYSRGDHLAIVDMSISYDDDIEKASALMEETGLAYMQNHDNILEQPHVLGVMELGDSDVVLRMIMRVKPLTHWETERALRQAIKLKFDENDVDIPYPHIVVKNG